MKYLCLVYGEEQKMRDVDDLHCLAFDQSVRKSGHCIASEALQPVSTATTVRVRDGRTLTTDGPYAETKEALGGLYVIEAADLDAALAWAARCPGSWHGSVEVRPIVDLSAYAQAATDADEARPMA